jgi:uncharacterized membrane protein YhaH (DUF805 family)
MSLLSFFLSFQGRICRQSWWLGFVILVAVTVPVSLMLDPEAFAPSAGEIKPPSLALTIWSLMTCLPTAAITIKRLNDRDWPSWIGCLLVVAFIVLIIANYFGLLLDPDRMTPPESFVFGSLMLFFLWTLVDNGFFKGSDGPNRYGPDPLAFTPDKP